MCTHQTMTVKRDILTHGQDIHIGTDLLSNSVQQNQKVSQKRLSKLMRFILVNTGDGIERAEIIAKYYNLDRRYCKFFTDPCFSRQEKRQFDRRFRRAQAAVTKSLDRLEHRGLVELVRRKQYVKDVQLTSAGRIVRQSLIHTLGPALTGSISTASNAIQDKAP